MKRKGSKRQSKDVLYYVGTRECGNWKPLLLTNENLDAVGSTWPRSPTPTAYTRNRTAPTCLLPKSVLAISFFMLCFCADCDPHVQDRIVPRSRRLTRLDALCHRFGESLDRQAEQLDERNRHHSLLRLQYLSLHCTRHNSVIHH